MAELKSKVLAEGVTVRNLMDQKFKTMRISMNIVVPLTKEYAACNALLPAIVSRVTKEYPEYINLSRYLSSLYGASLSSSVMKIGDNQILHIAASGISNKYALDGENIAEKLTDLICSSVFTPLKDKDGLFPEESFKQEKRQMIETIDANFNDKKTYALQKCMELFFEGEAAAIGKYGSKEDVENVSREELSKVWEEILRTARFEIFVLGDCDFDSVCRKLQSRFTFTREPAKLQNVLVPTCGDAREITEYMKVAQSKLVMAFRTGVSQQDSTALKVMAVIFGGSPASKLFLNVREKMSLCYYCSARLNDIKGAMIVESGVETENVEAAKTAILQQLDDMRGGDFTDTDIEAAKLAMINSYRAVSDSLYSTENWYLNQMFAEDIVSAEQMIDKVKSVTREEIIEAAKKVKLDTVYMLKGESADE